MKSQTNPMTEQQAKAAAEKIKHSFKYVNGRHSLDEEINPFGKRCAIIHVKSILNLQNQKDGKWLPCIVPDSMSYWNEILTELEKK